MKPVIIGVLLMVSAYLVTTVAAQDMQTSFSGINWGGPVAEARGLTLLRQSGDESYYTKPDDFYSLGGVTCDEVIYGFYQNQFYAAFMRISNQKDFKAVREHLTERFGDARSQMRMDRTIYIWDYLDVKIKLKHYEERPQSKLAYYYKPLSSKVNEARKATKSETVIQLDSESDDDDEVNLDF
jgi:hypothetical protein